MQQKYSVNDERHILEFNSTDFEKIVKLINDFDSYYENEKVWNFQDLEDQRQIACELIGIIKINKCKY